MEESKVTKMKTPYQELWTAGSTHVLYIVDTTDIMM